MPVLLLDTLKPLISKPMNITFALMPSLSLLLQHAVQLPVRPLNSCTSCDDYNSSIRAMPRSRANGAATPQSTRSRSSNSLSPGNLLRGK